MYTIYSLNELICIHTSDIVGILLTIVNSPMHDIMIFKSEIWNLLTAVDDSTVLCERVCHTLLCVRWFWQTKRIFFKTIPSIDGMRWADTQRRTSGLNVWHTQGTAIRRHSSVGRRLSVGIKLRSIFFPALLLVLSGVCRECHLHLCCRLCVAFCCRVCFCLLVIFLKLQCCSVSLLSAEFKKKSNWVNPLRIRTKVESRRVFRFSKIEWNLPLSVGSTHTVY